ncbi:hypothetical protein [Streptomyces sp. TRM72054]|uniref:hypothetical protein n=1 Tax=Streptomyces sp. TRM72054 TaxID=2870562 RepID=UPI0021AB8A2D|nr:hypothetical protein [Streptomyces sp. TRM72054]
MNTSLPIDIVTMRAAAHRLVADDAERQPGRARRAGRAMAAHAAESASLSAECTLARTPGYRGLHRDCRQTQDIPLPHWTGILLQRRCGCSCHAYNRRPGAWTPAPA